jgi:hypothetical protein
MKRHLRFSLRTFLLFVMLCGIVAGWTGSIWKWVHDRRDALNFGARYTKNHCFTIGLYGNAAPPWQIRLFVDDGVRLLEPRFDDEAKPSDIEYVGKDLVRLFPEATVRIVGDFGKVTEYGRPPPTEDSQD